VDYSSLHKVKEIFGGFRPNLNLKGGGGACGSRTHDLLIKRQ
jgi:hypothetical protein